MTNEGRIFLAHAREDKAQIRDLYDRLKERGLDPWLDEVDLIPGQVWKEEIPKAIAGASVFLACLSQKSVQKRSYIQREFRVALSAYAEMPQGSIYLIPVRLDDCEVPDVRIPDLDLGLTDLHWVDLFEGNGLDRLTSAIQQAQENLPAPSSARLPPTSFRTPDSVQTASVSAPRPADIQPERPPRRAIRKLLTIVPIIVVIGVALMAMVQPTFLTKLLQSSKRSFQAQLEPDLSSTAAMNYLVKTMVAIPAGNFMMGVQERDSEEFKASTPRHLVTITAPFELSKFEVTFREYQRFAAATEREEPGDRRWGRGERPVINVSWYDASAYCAWLSDITSATYRLPTEAEWEYAARAGTTSRYAFGNQITKAQARFDQDWGKGSTAKVGQYPPNDWGLFDMHGNVWEWVEDRWHNNYQGAPADGSAWLRQGDSKRVLRGGSWGNKAKFVRSANRYLQSPDHRHHNIGFRCARDLN